MTGHKACEEHGKRAGERTVRWRAPLNMQSVDGQAKIAVVLLAIIPALVCFYIGGIVAVEGNRSLPSVAVLVIVMCTAVVAVSGYLILRKYANNIIKLRHYVAEIAAGTLPENIHLDQSGMSDDLQCIEDGLNMILKGIETRMNTIEARLQIESGLRKALEQQQHVLLKAERHRVMLQSIGAACHHLGQPATALRMRLYLMREKVQTVEEMDEIDESIRDAEAIGDVLIKLREVSEYRTEPYLTSGNSDGSQILAI